MLRSTTPQGARVLARRPVEFVPDEVVVTTVPQAQNDSLPHFLNVASTLSRAITSYGDASIDGALSRLAIPVASVSRVFVPRSDATTIAATARAATPGLAALARTPLTGTYDADEVSTGLARTYKIKFQQPVNVPLVCSSLNAASAVETARPNYISRVFLSPRDEFYSLQWGLPAISAEAGWDIETGHPDVMVAIVDSGVDLNHDDLREKLQQGQDFVDFQGDAGPRYTLLGDYRNVDLDPSDEDGHGSHCAGIAAARSDNERGVVGVCWGGTILPVRVMFRVFDHFEGRETSVGTDTDIDAGIKYAVDAGAHAINLSLGGPAPSHETVLRYARDRNVCVLCATGNDDTREASYPASDPNTLAVGAVDANLNRASFSNYGPAYNQFVMAPGVRIGSTYKENGYVYLDGTSMATPFVTGLAGLMVSMALRSSRQLAVADVYRIIRETATPLRTGKGDLFCGEGLINGRAALEAVQQHLGL